MQKLYDQYVEKYRKLHSEEDGFIQLYPYSDEEPHVRHVQNKVMVGNQLVKKCIPFIKIHYDYKKTGLSVLDYGSGRAEGRAKVLFKLLEKVQTWCSFDPAVKNLDNRPPDMKFDVVICADVLEHVPEECLDFVLSDISSFLKDDGVVIFSTTGNLAHKTFLDGENIHCTLKEQKEWHNLIEQYIKRFILIYANEQESGEKAYRASSSFKY